MQNVTFSKLGKFGRLGNQLFQISATYAYARHYNKTFIIPKWKYSDIFPNIKKYEGDITSDMSLTHLGMDFVDITKWGCGKQFETLDLFGYFQSEKYFKKYSDEIKHLFQIDADIYNDVYTIFKRDDGKKNAIIHVRLNDYNDLTNIYCKLIDTGYYKKVFDYIESDESIGDVYVISDDIDSVKEPFSNFPYKTLPNSNEIRDFVSMIISENIVFSANSTFSWWGSYLNLNNKSYAPKKWFNNHFNSDILVREDMILL